MIFKHFQFFLMFGSWALEFLIFVPKIGFYEKFPPQNRLERSRIWFPLELIGNSLLNSPFKRGLGGAEGGKITTTSS